MNAFITECKERTLKRNQNVIAIIIGSTGSGKSWLGLRLCEMIDEDFKIDQCVFSAGELMDLLDSQNLSKGDCILWDEAGVDLGSRDFMTRSSKAMTKFLQTFRKMNLVLFFTLPTLDMLDTQARKLAHYILEPTKIDRNRSKTFVKIKRISTNVETGKVYTKYMRCIDTGTLSKVKLVKFKAPSIKLRHQYEKRKAIAFESWRLGQ